MNRTAKVAVEEFTSPLMGTLAIMGFAAEDNLRDVAHALGKRDPAGLSRVSERNAKQARLRAEIEELIIGEMALPTLGNRPRRKLVLASQIALMFERMGTRTVEIASLCEQILRASRPSRVTEIKKLVEHAVYITDRAATGVVEEDMEMARAAQEQRRAAVDLYARVMRELSVQLAAPGESATRADLLCEIACKAHGIIEDASQLAQDAIAFLERPEL